MSHRIFISHSHLDNDFGTKLAQDLRRVLVNEDAVFYDVLGGLHGGERWWNKIVEELTARDVFLIVLSPDSMNSLWVIRELDVALNENKYIIPLLYRKCDIRADLKILQSISFLSPKPYEAAFQEVLDALGPVFRVEDAKIPEIINSPKPPKEKIEESQKVIDEVFKLGYLTGGGKPFSNISNVKITRNEDGRIKSYQYDES